MRLIPIEKIFSNRDSIRKSRKAREAFLIQKGRTIDPDGLKIVMIFYFTVCLSLIYTVN